MPATYSDVLLVGGVPNQWIKLVSNGIAQTQGTAYVSDAVTTFPSSTQGGGVFSFATGPPADIYTVWTLSGSLSSTQPASGDTRWVATGNINYVVAYTAGDAASLKSGTYKSSSPYTNIADAGEISTQTVSTRHSGTGGTFSITAFQNTDTAAPDNATRIYVIPRAGTKVTTGTAGAIKIFADDYLADSTNYRDNGHYFSADQLGDYGCQGNGCFVMSSKVNGTYANGNPDLVFSFQDGVTTGARIAYQIDHATPRGVFVIGDRYMPEVAPILTATALEVHGEIGFNNTTPGIRWFASANADVTKADGTLDNNGPNGLGRITSATAAFTTADTYKVVTSANLTGAPATRIAYVVSATVAVLTAPVITPSSGQSFTIVARAPVAANNKLGLNNSDLTLTLNAVQRFKVNSSGSVIAGSTAAQMGTASTDGFLYVWSMAGSPSGVPTAVTGSVPLVIDTTGVKLWAYIGGAWKGVVLA